MDDMEKAITEKTLPVEAIVVSWERARRHLVAAAFALNQDDIDEARAGIEQAVDTMNSFFGENDIEFDPNLDPTLIEQDFDEISDFIDRSNDSYLEDLRFQKHQEEMEGDV